MLGRKDYTREEVDHAKQAIAQELAAYKKLAKAVDAAGPKAAAALKASEPVIFNNLALTLDRFFVHRIRMVTGKDGTPLNELELIVESLMNNEGVLRGNNVIKYKPDEAVLNLNFGDRISVTAADFDRLALAVFAEIESKFL